jgi:DNA-binding SARP family transcriptional activator
MLELNLFGIPELSWEGESLPLPSPKNLAILSYLALKGESVSRKDLSELFWKDGKPSNVRFVLHKLREIPGSERWLETNETFVCVKAITDVKRFEDAIKNERYSEALESHPHGEILLKGLELNDAEEFTNWLDLERSRLGQLYLEALQGHMGELEKTNKTDEALKIARQLLEQDKLNENVHRTIMRLEHKRGNTETALAQFEILRNILKEELGVEPLEDTLKLLRDIEGGSASSVKNALLLTSARAIPAKPEQLFGRDKLLNDVAAHLERKKRVLLHGFGGMGKTALATLVVAKWLEKNKAPVLWLQGGNDDATILFDAISRAFDAQQTLSQHKNAAKAIRDLLIKNKISLFVLDDVWNAYALSKVIEALPEGIPFLVTSRQRYPNLTRVDVGRLGREAALELLAHYSIPPTPLIKGGKDKPPLTEEVSRSDGGVLPSQASPTAKEEPPVLDLRGMKSTSSVDMPSPPVRGNNDEGANQLCELLGDHAFALRLAGLALREKNITVERLYEQIKNNPHDFKMPGELQEAGRESAGSLLSVSVEALEDRAYETFLSYGVLEVPVATPGFLASCLDREINQIEDALFALVQCGLAERVSKPGSDLVSYRIHDLAHSYAKANRLLRSRTLVAAALEYLQVHKDEVEILELDISNILAAAQVAKEQEREEELIDFMYLLTTDGSYFMARGYTRKSVELLNVAIEKAKRQGILEKAHYLLSQLGSYYYDYQKNYDLAFKTFDEARLLAKEWGNQRREAVLSGLVAYARFHQGKDDVDDYMAKAYEIAITTKDDECLCTVLDQLGCIAGLRGNIETSNKFLYESLEALDRLETNEIISQKAVDNNRFFLLLNIGETEHQLGDFAKGVGIREQALRLAEERSSQLWMGYAHYELGDMHHQVGHKEIALNHMSQALKLFEQNNAVKDIEAVRSFLEEGGYPLEKCLVRNEG